MEAIDSDIPNWRSRKETGSSFLHNMWLLSGLVTVFVCFLSLATYIHKHRWITHIPYT